jgi:hypothetical protein
LPAEARLVWPKRQTGRAGPRDYAQPAFRETAEPARAERRAKGWLWWHLKGNTVMGAFVSPMTKSITDRFVFASNRTSQNSCTDH